MKKFSVKVKGLWEKFKYKSNKMKNLVVAIFLVGVIGIISVIFCSSSNQYQVLFSNIDEVKLQTIVDTLKKEKVDAKIDESTNTITVPKNQVNKLRLQLAPILENESK